MDRGRARGHHSYEDFRRHILATHAFIRSQANTSLVAGSGFGEGEGARPYYRRMGRRGRCATYAFDGVLFGSWAVVAKELLVQAQGVNDNKREQTYEGETGAFLPCGLNLARLPLQSLTRQCSSSRKTSQAWLNANADSVIDQLNRDFAKPPFVQKKDGILIKDLGDLAYEETVVCLAHLVCIKMSRGLNTEAPVDFAIVMGWPVCYSGFRDCVLRAASDSDAKVLVFIVYHASHFPRVRRWRSLETRSPFEWL